MVRWLETLHLHARLALAALLVALALSGSPARADGFSALAATKWAAFREQLNVVGMARTARDNYRTGTYYAIDASRHTSMGGALRASLAPTDTRANVRAAFASRVHPFRLGGSLFRPLGLEVVRQLAAGEGLDGDRLRRALDPRVIGGMFAGTIAGEVGGAWLQSALARTGPAGAAAGFLLRPALAFAGGMLGYDLSRQLAGGKGAREAFRAMLAEFSPGRDVGQLIGNTLGPTIGQVLIPIPVVGAVIGATLGGVIGAAAGNWLWERMRGGKEKAAVPATETATAPPLAARPRAGSGSASPEDDGPGFANLRVTPGGP